MTKKRFFLKSGILMLFSLLVIFSGCASVEASTDPVASANTAAVSQVLNGESGDGAALALDPDVRTGVLDNGLTWYIRENRKPEARASLRLVIRAGSILEDEDQRGIAHLVEHMAFNGTENFEKMELVNYLESIGMAFGPEINAYTSFDETVYMLEVPTDDEEIVSKALLILEDWAHRLTMDPEEIDKERGVVREEWRLGRGASGRIRDQILPVLLGGSRYAQRLPIGEMDVVMNTASERVAAFYDEWYRPELMALIAVGDFDGEKMQAKIEEQFSRIPSRAGRERLFYDVPVNSEPLIKIVSDPEVQTANFELSIKSDTPSFRTEADYRGYLIRSIFWGILNSRLDEIAQEADTPFIGAQGSLSQFVSTRSFISYSGLVAPDGILRGLAETLKEVRRLIVHGILPEELERQKADHLSYIESAWLDRENRHSPSLAQELVSFHLQDVFMPGMEAEYALFSRLIPDISSEELNAYAETILPKAGRSLTVVLPESGLPFAPSEEELLALVAEADSWEPEPPEEDNLPEELMARPEIIASILDREENSEAGTVSWVLDNGAVVILKKTDFMEDEILFHALSSGGLSLLPDDSYHEGAYASLFLSESGLGTFSSADLGKILAGRDLRLVPYIRENFEGFSGETSPADLEVFFQLLSLHFTSPGFTKDSFDNVKSRLLPLIENRLADPSVVYGDRLNELVQSGAYRSKPLDREILEGMSVEAIERIYKERFSAPGDFVYLFVGNIDPDKLEEYSLRYLSGAERKWNEFSMDRGIRPPEGKVLESVSKGLEPKSRVTFYFHGEGEFSKEEKTAIPVLGAMVQTLLRELIREDLSGTYSIRSSLAVRKYPYDGWSGSVAFGCDPERAEELSEQVLMVLDKVKTGGIDEEYYVRELEKYRREYETGIKENSYWLSTLLVSLRDRETIEPPLTPEEFEKRLRSVPLNELADRIYSDDYIRLLLVPEA